MPRAVELNFKFGGNPGELKNITDYLRSIGGEANVASPKVEALEKQIEALKKSLEHIEKKHEVKIEGAEKFKEFQNVLKEAVEAPLRSANREGLHLLNSLGKYPAIAATAAFGLGLIAVKSYELFESQAEASHQLVNTSDKLGLTIDQTQHYSDIAKIAGVSVESFQGAARFLSVALEDQEGQGKRTAKALKELGINTHEMTGEQRQIGPVFTDVLEKLSKIEDASKRTFLAGRILPRGAAIELQPLIKRLQEYEEEIEKAGIKTDGVTVESLARAEVKINTLGVAWEHLKTTFAGAIEPIVVPIVVSITQSLKSNERTGQPFSAGLGGAYVQDPDDVDFEKTVREAVKAQADRIKNAANKAEGIDIEKDFSIAQGKKNIDLGQKLVKSFTKSEKTTLEGMKKSLTEVKKDAADLESTLSSGSLLGSVFEAKKKEYDKLQRQSDQLEASIKKAEEAKAIRRKLPELVIESRATLTAAQVKASGPAEGEGLEAFRKFGDEARNFNAELVKINAERAKMVKEIGDSPKVEELFRNKGLTALAKFSEETRKDFAENIKKATEGASSELKLVNAEWEKDLKETISVDEKVQKRLEEQLKLQDEIIKHASENKAKTTLGDIARTQRTTGAPEQVAEKQSLDVNVSLARELAQIDQERIEKNYAANIDALNAVREVIGDKKTDQQIEEAANDRDLELLKNRQELEKQIGDSRLDYEQKIADLRAKQLDAARDEAGKVFDAITNPAKFQSFITDFFKDQGKALFQNLTQGIFQNISQTLGGIGQKSGLGGVLRGTALDPAHAPVEANTSALLLAKASIDTLTSTISGTAVGGGSPASISSGGLSGTIKSLDDSLSDTKDSSNVANLVSDAYPGLTTGNVAQTNSDSDTVDKSRNVGGGVASVGALGGILGALTSIFKAGGKTAPPTFTPQGTGTIGNPGTGANNTNSFGNSTLSPFFNEDSSTSSKVLGGAATAGVLFAGVEGVLGGIKQGGARGALGATGAVLGTAAALDPEPISKAALAIGAIVAGGIKALLGDPKLEREKKINDELSDIKYSQPNPITLSIDAATGKIADTDFRGRARVVDARPTLSTYQQATGFDPDHPDRVTTTPERYFATGSPVANAAPKSSAPIVNIYQNVQAWDSRNFIDNAHEVAGALTKAIKDGHRVRGDIINIISPGGR